MEKFRKKPVVIDAQQITVGDFDNDHPNDSHITGVIYDPKNLQVYVKTLEGTMTAGIRDWIIRGVKGELYPCREDIFALTYEPADSHPEPMVPLRPQLATFAAAMEETLKTNDDKGGWDDDHPNWLRHRLVDEANELAVEVSSGNYAGMMREAVDVANFAMMIYDVAAIRAAREGAK